MSAMDYFGANLLLPLYGASVLVVLLFSLLRLRRAELLAQISDLNARCEKEAAWRDNAEWRVIGLEGELAELAGKLEAVKGYRGSAAVFDKIHQDGRSRCRDRLCSICRRLRPAVPAAEMPSSIEQVGQILGSSVLPNGDVVYQEKREIDLSFLGRIMEPFLPTRPAKGRQ